MFRSSNHVRLAVRGGVAGFLALALASAAHAQLPTAQLTTLFPPGAKIGSTIDVRVGGGDLDDARELLFTHPGITATPKMSPATQFEAAKPIPNLFEVRIAGDVPPGRYEARVSGRFGVSNPRAFVVGELPETNDPGGNAQPDKALAIAVDTVVNGSVDGNQVDHFKLPLKAGQRVVITCHAQRIDSRLDGTLVLLDPAGKELMRNRDYDSRDPLLDFTAPADGEYRLQLYDFTYRGGGEYFYRLTAQTTPWIDYVFPPSGLPGSNERYTVYGRNLPGGSPAEAMAAGGGAPLQKLDVHIALPADDASRTAIDAKSLVFSNTALLDGMTYRLNGSNPVRIYFAKGSVVAEKEPNDKPEQVTEVHAPCEVVGQFYPATDVDAFQFAAKKGETFRIELFSHRLGMNSDAFMLVQKVKKNEKGEETLQDIAQVDDPGDRAGRIGSEFDTSTDDPEYQLTADEDALYRVTVRDQYGDARVDPRFVYRLAIHRGAPDFRVVAYATPPVVPANPNAVALGGCVLRKGGSTPIEVRVDRRNGFAGEIEISAQGLPPGVTCPNVVIGGTGSSATMVLSAAEDAAGWTGPIRIVGRATIGDMEAVRYARSGIPVWNAGNRQQEYVSYRLAGDLALSVIDKETLPAQVAVAEDKIWETSRGGKLEIPVKVTRRGEFKDDLTLAANDLPNELKPANLVVKGADAEGKLQFAATNANAKPGVYTFYLRADAKLKHQRNPDAVAAAEQEQKAIDAAVAASTEQNNQAVAAKNAAVAAAQTMAAAVKTAEQAKTAAEAEAKQAADKATQADAALKTAKEAAAKDTANQALAAAAAAAEKAKAEADAAKGAADQKLAAAIKALTDAQNNAKGAEDAKVAAEKAAAEADARLKAAQQAKAAVDKRLNDAKTANNPKDLQFAVISTPIKVRVAETCLRLSANASGSVKQGAKLEIPVKIDRLYGFDDAVEVEVQLPGGIKGVTAAKVAIPKGQAEGKVEIVTTNEAPAGTHTVTLLAKGKFNNIDNQSQQAVTITIAAP